MVTTRTLMTMVRQAHHWSVASAKAELARLVEEAQRRPQVIERRGKPVAVVVAIDQFEDGSAAARWQGFLAESAKLRESGGAEFRIPRRGVRASPLGRA
jgi:prevent-host-death family protein